MNLQKWKLRCPNPIVLLWAKFERPKLQLWFVEHRWKCSNTIWLFSIFDDLNFYSLPKILILWKSNRQRYLVKRFCLEKDCLDMGNSKKKRIAYPHVLWDWSTFTHTLWWDTKLPNTRFLAYIVFRATEYRILPPV